MLLRVMSMIYSIQPDFCPQMVKLQHEHAQGLGTASTVSIAHTFEPKFHQVACAWGTPLDRHSMAPLQTVFWSSEQS